MRTDLSTIFGDKFVQCGLGKPYDDRSGKIMFKIGLKWEIQFISVLNHSINCQVNYKSLNCALFNKSLTSPLLTATYSTKHIELTDLSTFLVDKFIL